MRWKSEPVPATPSDEGGDLRERIRAELEARGVAPVPADALAEAVARELGSPSELSSSVLDGMALGLRAQGSVTAALSKSASDVQEIERLMTSFASELSKLDEVLEVLAAQLRRMRAAAPGASSRTLH